MTRKRLTGQRNQCPSCHEYFNSNSAFDKHRTGPFTARRCLSRQEMTEKGMILGADEFWRGSAMPEHLLSTKEQDK